MPENERAARRHERGGPDRNTHVEDASRFVPAGIGAVLHLSLGVPVSRHQTRGPVLPPLRDRIRPGVRVLFVGINPGIRSSLTGHHFAGFSNRFWKLLHESKLVPEPITYEDDDRLPEWGYGVTNIVARATPGIDTLNKEEYVD